MDLIISVWYTIQTNIAWRYPVFRIAGPTDKYRLTVSGGYRGQVVVMLLPTTMDAILLHMIVIMMAIVAIVAIGIKEDGGIIAVLMQT